MPRGKRKTCTEKLCEVREMIEALETQLKDLKAKEKELLKERREEDLKHIADILEERNLTPDELAGILDQMSPAERVRLVSHVDPDEQAEWQAV
ncbi:H-NS histone family protein [Clostridium transplantifaecale]|uniref:H-NS histone family protein n=1 Tax=Clostridium transplantifaecale TaxID=2479838 RepID=UPI000F63BFF6|nr:H-NS histone family protein [Clostridium transplantifaecale]